MNPADPPEVRFVVDIWLPDDAHAHAIVAVLERAADRIASLSVAGVLMLALPSILDSGPEGVRLRWVDIHAPDALGALSGICAALAELAPGVSRLRSVRAAVSITDR